MNIGLDAHALGSKVGGNETYIRNLVNAMMALDSKNSYFVYLMHPNSGDALNTLTDNFRSKYLWPKTPALRIPFATPYRALLDRLDVLLLQYAAPPLCPTPYVLVVHDIAYERFPEHFTKVETARFKMLTPFSAHRAAHIITCSENSKKDLVHFYKIDPAKITVVYYGRNNSYQPTADTARLEGIRQKYKTGDRFLLCVANLQPRKNLPRLIAAFKRLKQEQKIPHKLVLVGNKAWLFSDIFAAAREAGLDSEIVMTGYVPAEDLPLLYAAAEVFVYPSIFEGFGLPVVEAMACGTPVVTSRSSSLVEVAGDATLLVDPLSVDDIAENIHRALSQPELRAALSAKGIRQANTFTWDKTAEKTLRIFESAHATKRRHVK